jgi:hypothetical protein
MGLVSQLEGLAAEQLAARSDDVLEWIRTRKPKWADFAEPVVAEAVREGHLFAFASLTALVCLIVCLSATKESMRIPCEPRTNREE